MVAINKILLPECTGEGCGGGTGNPPREARLHAYSPFHFPPSAGAADRPAPFSHEATKNAKTIK